jgi:hypothetical protein
VTAPHRGRGRRDNGLQAPLWAPLRDVDPRVGEHLLDLLRDEGIAAYLEPATDVQPYTRSVYLPSPPSDRLFVDRARRTDARVVVDRHGDTGPTAPPAPRSDADAPSRRPIDDDPEFAALVAAFEADHGPVPAVVEEPAPDPAPAVEPLPAVPESTVLSSLEDHYEPPPPPPVPMLAPIRLYALLLILAGAVLIVAPGRLGLSLDVGLVLGVAGVVTGVAVLVSRMRDRSVDDGDDGAVV